MKLERSLDYLSIIGDGKNYNKEWDYLWVETSTSQYSASEIMDKLTTEEIQYLNTKIHELQESDLYQRKTDCHGKRHVENVMLFAGIIASCEQLTGTDRDLLMEAAKYHDQGRDNDFDEQHGIESAYIASRALQDKYSEEDVKIIEAAIMFHDDRTKGKSIKEIEDEGFSQITNRLKLSVDACIRARRIGNILKDADALDRARFAGQKSPIGEHFLRTETSLKLIQLAFQLHEAYSQDDLETLLQDEKLEVINEVNDYKNATSPIRAKKYYEKNILAKTKAK